MERSDFGCEYFPPENTKLLKLPKHWFGTSLKLCFIHVVVASCFIVFFSLFYYLIWILFIQFFPVSIIPSSLIFRFWVRNFTKFFGYFTFSRFYKFSIDFIFPFCSVLLINSVTVQFLSEKIHVFLGYFYFFTFTILKKREFSPFFSAIETHFIKPLFSNPSGFHHWLQLVISTPNILFLR